jgi:hypothetical protein
MSMAPRANQEMTALVQAVRDAAEAEAETDSLEWKTDWDLREPKVRFETARHILGFGNRSVRSAGAPFEGCGVLLAGVAPNALVGIEAMDPAELEDGIGKYVASGSPRWSPHYVSVEGKTVLAVIVEAPKAGDPICTLQKGYESVPAGRIFVRRNGQTSEANPNEVRALEGRIADAGRVQIDLSVELRDPDLKLRQFVAEPGDYERWLAAEGRRLALPSQSSMQPWEVSPRRLEDIRGRDDYEVEVRAYLKEAELRWKALLLATAVKRSLASVELDVINRTDRNFSDVEVVVHVSGTDGVWLAADEIGGVLNAPLSPSPWGKHIPKIDLSAFRGSEGKVGNRIRRFESKAQVRFAGRDIRPGERAELEPIHLSLIEGGPDEIRVEWRLTSTGADGSTEGDLPLGVDSAVVEIAAA